MHIEQDAHHLGHADRRVGIVQLDGGFVRQVGDMAERLHVAAHEVLQRGRYEEVFLAQAQFLTGGGGIGRGEHLGDRFRLDLGGQRAGVIAVVESIQPQRVGRMG